MSLPLLKRARNATLENQNYVEIKAELEKRLNELTNQTEIKQSLNKFLLEANSIYEKVSESYQKAIENKNPYSKDIYSNKIKKLTEDLSLIHKVLENSSLENITKCMQRVDERLRKAHVAHLKFIASFLQLSVVLLISAFLSPNLLIIGFGLALSTLAIFAATQCLVSSFKEDITFSQAAHKLAARYTDLSIGKCKVAEEEVNLSYSMYEIAKSVNADAHKEIRHSSSRIAHVTSLVTSFIPTSLFSYSLFAKTKNETPEISMQTDLSSTL